MIKQDIVDNVANATGLTKVEVEAVLNESFGEIIRALSNNCLLYTSPSPRDISGSRMPSSA